MIIIVDLTNDRVVQESTNNTFIQVKSMQIIFGFDGDNEAEKKKKIFKLTRLWCKQVKSIFLTLYITTIEFLYFASLVSVKKIKRCPNA